MKPVSDSHNLIVLGGLVAGVALLVGTTWLQWQHNAHMDEAANWVTHTQHERDERNRLLLLLLDVETGARGYVLTGNPAYLEPYEASRKALPEQLRTLRRLTADDAEQRKNLDALELLIAKRIDASSLNIRLRQESGFEAAREEVASGRGQLLMDQIRAAVQHMDAVDQALLVERSAANQRHRDTTHLWTVTSTGVSLALFVTMVALLWRENRHRQQVEASLRQANEQLEQRVRARSAELEQERNTLAAAFENTDMGLVLSDGQGGAISMNAAALRFHGFASVEDMRGRIEEYPDEWGLRYPDGRIMPYGEWPLPRAIRGDYVRDYETHLRNLKTGYEWVCSYTAAPVRSSVGDVTLIVLTLLDITERCRANAKLRRASALIEAINQAQTQFITAENLTKIFDSLLEKLLSLTGSEYGFIDELLYTADGQPYLVARAITNIAWNDEARALYAKFLTGELRFTNMGSLFGAVVATGATVIANDAPNDSRGGGIPPGHPSLNAFLGLPLRSGEGLVGVIGLANAPGGYSEQTVTFLEPMVTGCANIIAALRNDQRRRQLEEQLRQAQKMEAVGRLAGGIAHDFNNNIFVINGYCDLLLAETAGQPSIVGPLKEIKKAAHLSAALTGQLLAFSRRQMLQSKVLDPNAELVGIEPMLRRLIGEEVALTLMLGQGIGHVKADPNLLQQVVMNLAVNAKDAMPHGGQLTIETSNVELDDAYARSRIEVTPGPYVLLSVSDTGHGMDRETLAHMFEPFFTTKGKGKGTGLGLATAYGIVKQNRGHIAIYSEPGQGTTLKIYLPRVDEPVETTERRVTEELRGGAETILLVEDEAAVRELARRVLAERGYQMLLAANGSEALQLAERYHGPIHLLLTDVVMPEMSGAQLAERLTAIRPEIRVIYMSGYTENAIVHHGVLEAKLTFLPKPFPTDVLLRTVREILDARPPTDVRRRRILVVDDSEADRILQAHMLSAAGCTVLEAASGAEALGLLEREAVDAVITDVNMPEMDGFALTEAIRRSPQWQTLPVIILSGACTEDEQARSRAVGAMACLSKGTTGLQDILNVLAQELTS